MKLSDIKDCPGIEETPPSIYCSRAKVSFHNLLKASEADPALDEEIRFVLEAFLANVEIEYGPVAASIHIDRIYRKFVEILSDNAPRLLFNRQSDFAPYQNETAISLQPLWAFEFWLNDDPFSRKPEYSAADITHLSREAQAKLTVERAAAFAREKDTSDRIIGKPGSVMFLTPNTDAVADMHTQVSNIYGSRRVYDEDALEAAGIATRLRNLLGLYLRVESEPVVLLETDQPIGRLHSEAKQSRGATPPDKAGLRIAAPTQFDAGDYPRFRYWPDSPRATIPDYGRTWDLDRAYSAKGPQCGAPEFVVSPMPLKKIKDIVPAGRVNVSVTPHDLADQEDAEFADMVCAGRSLPDLVEILGARFAL